MPRRIWNWLTETPERQIFVLGVAVGILAYARGWLDGWDSKECRK